MKEFFKVEFSNNSYRALNCSPTEWDKYEIVVEVSKGSCNQYNDQPISLTIFHYGRKEDFTVGEWKFSYALNGSIHYPGSYANAECEIEAIKNNGQYENINIDINSCRVENLISELFMSIYKLGYSANAKEYNALLLLDKKLEKSNYIDTNNELKLEELCADVTRLHNIDELIKQKSLNLGSDNEPFLDHLKTLLKKRKFELLKSLSQD